MNARMMQIHPDNPQQRLITQAVEVIRQGGVVVYPTDSGYALGCHIGDKEAMERIQRIRRLDERHNFTLVCKDLSEIALYAQVDNATYRLLKNLTPGPYTFILPATKEVPRRLKNPKRKTIGIRVPQNTICHALLESLNEPLMSSSLIMPGEELPMAEPYEIQDLLAHHVDLVIDGGYCGIDPTTVLDLTEEVPVVVRQGLGPADFLES